ncbi:N-acetylmuramate alpha-1-phosphate uridylyltransferase MurU [Pseudoalteromonas luteoviolacea]|uniref:N-acetylmuramate alpha-1-phosphate uridylyltransferase MurU n=1 Tax=Pseudoalteromonas luteoviolacea TaxID=43657 RepID=UPI001B37955E|nr:nucleotidyltransferase family protein [Pseudoalteromonas luteoviolacea]MBQ4838796.1 nucleotidyltransferase family protein [Pseudoalteromonas luteoviolacea]
MKAMILAAGRGQRMMPLTADMPKPLLEVGNKPLIEYHLERLKLAGITQVVINLAWQGEKIERYFGDGKHLGLQIDYSYEPDGGLETAGGIVKAMPMLCEDHDTFIVINGDIFTDYDVHALSQLKLMPAEAHLVLVENPSHNPAGDFRLSHQPANEQTYTFSGIGLYHRAFFDNLSVEKIPLGPMLRSGIEEGMVSCELYVGAWHDIGTPERLAEINAALEASNVG